MTSNPYSSFYENENTSAAPVESSSVQDKNPYTSFYPEEQSVAPEQSSEEVGSVKHSAGNVSRNFGGTFSSMIRSTALAIHGPDEDLLEGLRTVQEGKTPIHDRLELETRERENPGKFGFFPEKNPIAEPGDWYILYKAHSFSPEQRQELIDNLETKQQDAMKTSLYEAGNKLDSWIKENTWHSEELEGTEGIKGFVVNDLSQGVGSMLGFISTALLTKKFIPASSTAGATASTALTGAAVNQDAEFTQALESGATIQEAFETRRDARYIGMSEAVPIFGWLDRVDKASGGTIKASLVRVLKQGTEEAIQEFSAEIANAANRENVYDPDTGLWDITSEAGKQSAVGFTTGVMLQALTELIIPGKQGSVSKPKNTEDKFAKFDEANLVDQKESVELEARQQAEADGGDNLDQALAAQNAIDEIETQEESDTNFIRSQESAAARDADLVEQERVAVEELENAEQVADETYLETPEGRVFAKEQELINEQAEAEEKTIATENALQRMEESDISIQPGTQLDAALQEKIAAEEKAIIDKMNELLPEQPSAGRNKLDIKVPENLNVKRTAEKAKPLEAGSLKTDVNTDVKTKIDAGNIITKNAVVVESTKNKPTAKTNIDDTSGVVNEIDVQLDEALVKIKNKSVEGLNSWANGRYGRAKAKGIKTNIESAIERHKGVKTKVKQRLDTEAHQAATSPKNNLPEPTQAQIEAGNYQKGHISVSGLDISIENPKDSVRSGVGPDGKQWSTKMKHHYGYVKRSEGADGEQVDVFVGPNAEAQKIFVVDQVDQDSGKFDEHKAMVGFDGVNQAKKAYASNYDKGWKVGPVAEMSTDDFKSWIENDNTKKPIDGTLEASVQKPASNIQPEISAETFDVKKEVTRLNKSIPAVNAEVVDTFDQLPDEIKTAKGVQPGKLNAVYDATNDKVFVVADKNTSPQQVQKAILHEGVTHKGLRYFMDDKTLNETLDAVYKSADKSAINQIEQQYKFDNTSEQDRRDAAEEHIAKLAESHKQTGSLARVVATVRRALRKLGLVRKWTDSDIHDLLRRVRKKMSRPTAKKSAVNKPNETKVYQSLDDKGIEYVNNNPKDSMSAGMKTAVTVEEMTQLPTDRSIFKKIKDSMFAEKVNSGKILSTLKMIPTRNIADFADKSMTAVHKYNQLNKRMVGRESELTAQSKEIIDPWMDLHRKNRKDSEMLTGVMHRSTLARVDPSKPYVSKLNVEEETANIEGMERAISKGAKNPLGIRRAMASKQALITAEQQRYANHTRLKPMFDSLSSEAKKVFNDTRNMFESQYNTLQRSMEKRLDTLQTDDKTKQALRAFVEKTFESNTVKPYFPLSRYGKYWAYAKKNGELLAYSQFEKKSERDSWMSEWNNSGADIDGGIDSNAGNKGDGPRLSSMDPEFTLDVVKKIKNINPIGESESVNELIDDVWQMYLRSLPEMSARKHFIHRKGVIGFTGDGLRSVADASLRNARRIAKVEYQYQIENALKDVEKQAKAVQLKDDWAIPIHDELKSRHDWHMNHTSSPVASTLTSLGFHWYLGLLRPSAGIVNLTQTALVGMPVLSAFSEGKGSAFVELSRAARDVGSLLRFAKDPYTNPDTKKRFNKNDVKAIHDIEQKFALFDKTRTHDLIGLQEAGGKQVTSKWRQLHEVSGWVFHNTEVYNRKVTALAAYRLGKKKGLSHDESVYRAVQLTEDSHFDYSSQNRPAVLHKDWARVAFLFRNYSINMYYYLARNFHDSIKGESREKKIAAAKKFYGTMGMTAALAGGGGLPFVWSLSTAVDMVWELFDDDEKEEMQQIKDPKTRTREFLTDIFEKEGADIIMDGILDGIPAAINKKFDTSVPNPSFSSRLTLANIAFQDAPANAPLMSREWWTHYIGELMGPSIGLIQDFGDAGYEVYNGNHRAWETLTPSTVTDQIKAVRMSMDGIETRAGAQVVDKEDLDASDYAMQMIGFSPYKVTQQYEKNRAMNFVNQRLEWRANHLRSSLKNAVRFNENTDELVEEIKEFNNQYPAWRVNPGETIKNQKRIDRRFIDGTRVPSRRRQRALQEEFAD